MKYELTEKKRSGLTQIRALRDIPRFGIKAGDLGGWIESEANLSQYGDAWISGNARVYGSARVFGDARVFGSARVYGNAWVCDSAWVYDSARVYGNTWVYGGAWIYDDAEVYESAWVNGDARVFTTPLRASRSDGYDFIMVPTVYGPRIIAGCRYFTKEEALKHWGTEHEKHEETAPILDYLFKAFERQHGGMS